MAGLRGRIRAHPVGHWVYRVAVAVAGSAVIAAGIVLLPAPGPGWVVIFAGLGILATEFAWARRLLHFARRKVRAWTAWAARQSLVVRGCLAIAGLVLLAGVALAGAMTVGWNPFRDG